MAKKTAEDLDTLLQPLLQTMTIRGCRLVARPGRVSLDRVGGATWVEVNWGALEHERALGALVSSPARLADGTTVVVLAGYLVLQGAPDPSRRTDDLVSEGWLSPLAARSVTHAVGLGRNVLLVGPRLVCAELAAAVLAEGKRPAMIGGPAQPSPPGWPLFADVAAARTYGADRVGAWSLDAAALTQVMSELCGVVGWIDARRLDRGLVRFELAGDNPAGSGPLRVLAAIDLVVVVADEPNPRVREVTEIVLHDDGYRPVTLFASGQPPVPTALVPVAAPSFLSELDHAGHSVLADELRHAVGASSEEGRDLIVPASAPVVAISDIAPEPEISHVSLRPQPFGAPRPPAPDPSLDDAPPPGWELDQLDQLGDEVIATEVAAINDPDAAVMAASYGLGPPPRPAGVPEGVDGPFDGTFADALERARERDAQLRAELEHGDGISDTDGRFDSMTDSDADS